jgi:hypothetical protein
MAPTQKSYIKYMLLSITEKLHIRNTVDAIKIPPQRKRPLDLVCHLKGKTVLGPPVNSITKVSYNRYSWGSPAKNRLYIHQLCWHKNIAFLY